MLLFQTLNHALYVGFELSYVAMARGLFQLAVAYAIGSPPRLEDRGLPILCQPLVCHVLFDVVIFSASILYDPPFLEQGNFAVKSGDPAVNQPRPMIG